MDGKITKETMPGADDSVKTDAGIGENKYPREVSITNIDIPFGSMVSFMIKWAFATIPAAFLVYATINVLINLLKSFVG